MLQLYILVSLFLFPFSFSIPTFISPSLSLSTKHHQKKMSTLISCQLATFIDHLETTANSLPKSFDTVDNDVTAFTESEPSTSNAHAVNDTDDDDLFAATIIKPKRTDDDWFLASAELTKLSKNTDLARNVVISLQQRERLQSSKSQLSGSSATSNTMMPVTASPVPALRARLAEVSAKASEAETLVRAHLSDERERARVLKRQQHQQQFDVTSHPGSSPLSPTSTTSTTSTTKPASSPSSSTEKGNPLSLDQKLTIQQSTQDTLSTDILKLVRTIKADAISFSEKLALDTAVMEGAAGSLERSSGVMGRVGSKLNEYQRSTAIGWWFYIMAVVFLVAAVSGSMIVIRIFPKW